MALNEAIKLFALGFASFAVGFNLCNVIWMFFSPHNKSDDRNNKTPYTEEDKQVRFFKERGKKDEIRSQQGHTKEDGASV